MKLDKENKKINNYMRQLDTEDQVLFHINRPTDFYRELKISHAY